MEEKITRMSTAFYYSTLLYKLKEIFKGTDTDEWIEMDQYRIDIDKLIRTICHLQHEKKICHDRGGNR